MTLEEEFLEINRLRLIWFRALAEWRDARFFRPLRLRRARAAEQKAWDAYNDAVERLSP